MPLAKRAGVALALSLSSIGATASASHAQEVRQSKAQRSGITGGLSVGVGSLGLGNDSHGTFDYAASFGGYLTPQWALAVEFWGGLHSNDEFHLSHHNRGLSAQYWMQERNIWLKGMLGTASMTSSFGDTTFADFVGVAFAGACGWMFYERGDYHADVQLRISVEGFEGTSENATAISLAVGVAYF